MAQAEVPPERGARAFFGTVSPLQRIALGLIIVFLIAKVPAKPDPSWQQYDLYADPIGWLLVLWGVFAIDKGSDRLTTVKWTASISALVSLPMFFPQLSHQLDESGQWYAALPEALFCFFLCFEISKIAVLRVPPDKKVATRFSLLGWGFVLVIVLSLVVLGGNVVSLDATTQTVTFFLRLALIVLLFLAHRREVLGGPGPKDYSRLVAETRKPPPPQGQRPST